MKGSINIKKLSLDELIGVVNIYPWYSGARKELCMRMRQMGWEASTEGLFTETALYLPSRRKLSDMIRTSTTQNLTDAEIDMIIKSYIVEEKSTAASSSQTKRKSFSGVGDYFSQEDYEQVRQKGDNIFSQYTRSRQKDVREEYRDEPAFDLYTETLAQIYAEQGYFEQAKEIYSKLILAYPEKNAYFAALIQKIDDLK